MSFSNRTAQAILNSLFGRTSNFGAFATAPVVYVGLSQTTPTETGGNVTEPVGGGYARVSTSVAGWSNATLADPSVLDNATTIAFTTASGDWVSGSNLTFVVLYDAAAAGNFLGAGALGTAKPILTGDQALFNPANVSITLD